MANRIVVDINMLDVPFEYYKHGNLLVETYVVSRLREAGIPVKGVLCFKGVERGKLVCIDFTHKDIKQFTWTDE